MCQWPGWRRTGYIFQAVVIKRKREIYKHKHKKLGLRVKAAYWFRDYDTALAFNEPGQEAKEYTGVNVDFRGEYEFLKHWSAWCEVEVEFAGRCPPGVVEEIVARLRRAGTGPAHRVAKHLRALGLGSGVVPEVSNTGPPSMLLIALVSTWTPLRLDSSIMLST